MTPTQALRRRIEQRLFGAADEPATWTPCGGGMSDARVWRVATGESAFAVRSMAGSDERSGWRCELLRHTRRALGDWVASPNPLSIDFDDSWEFADWREGAPATPAEAAVAADALARFHQACREIERAGFGPSPGFATRIEALSERRAAPVDGWPDGHADIGQRIDERIPAATQRAMAVLARPRTAERPVQPIHGDARPDHFLCRGGRINGLIDFDAMRVDSVLIDLARLAGELARGDRTVFEQVVAAYRRSVGDGLQEKIDLETVVALDLAGAVVAADRWRRWLRSPTARRWRPADVRRRLEAIAARLCCFLGGSARDTLPRTFP